MKIKVGLVGTSKLSFPGPKEEVYAKTVELMKKMRKTSVLILYIGRNR